MIRFFAWSGGLLIAAMVLEGQLMLSSDRAPVICA